MTAKTGLAAAAEIRARADEMVRREQAAGYRCEFVKPPDWLRAAPGCRGCKCSGSDGQVTYGICYLTRRYESDKLVRFSFITLCEDCQRDDATRERVCDIIFAGTVTGAN